MNEPKSQTLDERYQKQIESWRKATGKRFWTQLIPATGYFFADERKQKELRSPTITNTVQARPGRDDGTFNLLTLIGTFYALGGIQSKESVEAFFSEHLIDLPAHMTWQTIWQQIEYGTAQYRRDLEQPRTSTSTVIASTESSHPTSPLPQPEPIPSLPPASDPSIASKSKPTGHLRLVQALAGIVPFLAALIGLVLGKSQANSSAEVGSITLIGTNNQLLTLRVGNQTISAHDEMTLPTPIGVGEVVTVSFKIQNTDTHPVRIQVLSGGAQGPSSSVVDWHSPQSPFPPVPNIRLQPGETYEYSQSRAFFTAGNYFVEPTMQDATGQWGGIQPFTRIYFTVR